jgi:hypothetical protein
LIKPAKILVLSDSQFLGFNYASSESHNNRLLRSIERSRRLSHDVRYLASAESMESYFSLCVYPICIPRVSFDDTLGVVVTQRLLFLEIYETYSSQVGLYMRPISVVRAEDPKSWKSWKSLLSYPPLKGFDGVHV